MTRMYEGRLILSAAEFATYLAAGWFNTQTTYDDYLAMIREQEELVREAQEKAAREGYELGAPQLDLTPEDEAILDRIWARRAAEIKAVEANALPVAKAA